MNSIADFLFGWIFECMGIKLFLVQVFSLQRRMDKAEMSIRISGVMLTLIGEEWEKGVDKNKKKSDQDQNEKINYIHTLFSWIA